MFHETINIGTVDYYNTSLSFVAVLKIAKITLSQAGTYTCAGYNQFNEPVQNETVFITVAGKSKQSIFSVFDFTPAGVSGIVQRFAFGTHSYV